MINLVGDLFKIFTVVRSFIKGQKFKQVRDECFNNGGMLVLNDGIATCVDNPKKPILDDGDICVNNNDCEGHCLSEDENSVSGVCGELDIEGCYYHMENGESVNFCFNYF